MASLAKITAPKPSRVYARERLFAILDDARSRAAVWIHGPPGAGKTTLIATYLESRAIPFVWYQIDEGDGDIATFFYYFGLAAAKAAPRRKKLLPLFTPEYAKGITVFTRRYFEEIYSRLKPPFVIVLDNYQDAPAESALHEVIRDSLDVAPPGITVLAASRVAPPPAYARPRANGSLEIVDWEELRLTTEEAQSIVRLRTGNDVSSELLARAQGWCAGLTLMLAGGQEAAARSLEQSTPQELFDYFAGEIFDKTDRKTQDFLMETAFLPRVSINMAQALTAHRDAEAILDYLTRHSYFTTRHGQAEPFYQYHPLFREFLIARARENFSTNRLAALRSDGARLLAANGAVDEAADLWCDLENWEALAELLAANAPALLAKGRNQTLEKWLAAMPDAFFQGQPWLLYWRAAASMPFDPARSQPWFERAFELFEKRADRAGLFKSWAGITQAIRWRRNGDVKEYDRWIAVLEKLLADDPGYPSEDIEYQVAEAMTRALFWRSPLHADYARWQQRALALAHSCPDLGRRVYTQHVVATYEMLNGHFAEARALIESAAKVDLRELPFMAQNFAYHILALYQRETGQSDTCLKTVDAGLEASAASGVQLSNFHICGHGVWTAIACGQLDRAEKLLARMADYHNVDVPGEGCWYAYLASWLAARRGDLAAARLHAQRAIDFGADWAFFQTWGHSAMSCVLTELADYQGAARHVGQALAISRRIGTDRLLYGGLLMRAGIDFAQGDTAAALAALTDALALGKKRGYANCAWWDDRKAVRLCAIALEAGIETDYVREIIRGRKLTPASLEIENWPWPLKIYTLGSFAVLKDDQPLAFSRKAPKKPIALLKAIIAFGPRDVPQRQLIDALWPDEEGDAGAEALNISVHRLRKLLGDNDFVIVQEGCVSLNESRCWVDAWAFERLIDRVDSALGQNGDAARTPPDTSLALYRGAFLAADFEEPWALSARERLRAKFIRHIGIHARALIQAGHWEQALDSYQRGLEADDLAEEFYQGIMRCYRQLERRAEGIAVYRRMRQTLSVTLGIQPSAASEALYHALHSP